MADQPQPNTPHIQWWVTTILGAAAAAAGGYATSDLPGNDVAASVAGLLGLVLGYLFPGRGRPQTPMLPGR